MNKKRIIHVSCLCLAGLLVVMMTLSGCKPREGNKEKASQAIQSSQLQLKQFIDLKKNVILISIDTLRADGLGAYSRYSARTPVMDKLANEGLQCLRAYCQIPVTGPSHYSILSGVYAHTHNVYKNGKPYNGSFPSLASILKKKGYRCAAFISGTPLAGDITALSEEFHTYQDSFLSKNGQDARDVQYITFDRVATDTVELVNDWLEQVASHRFFLFLHLYDPHAPYRCYPEYLVGDYAGEFMNADYSKIELMARDDPLDSNPYWRFMLDRYYSEVDYVDHALAVLMRKLKSLGLIEDSIIALVSDHGESFDHGYLFDHTDSLYESCLSIPLIIYAPSIKKVKGVIAEPTESIDLAPTLLSLLNIPIPEYMEGDDLFVNDPKQYAIAETKPLNHRTDRGYVSALIYDDKKLIHNKGLELFECYNLLADPGEMQPMKETGTDYAMLAQRLKTWQDNTMQFAEPKLHEPKTPLPGHLKEGLRALGYIK